MQSNLMEKETVENKRLSTATSVSLSVATSASPSLLSETSYNNSILSRSPTPSSISNYVNNQIQGKDSKSESDKKKLKNVLHKFFKTKKIFMGNGHHHHGHHKKNSYSHSLNDESKIYEKNVYGYPSNGKLISNANANASINANTVSTSQPASLYYVDKQDSNNQSNIDNNYLTTPNAVSQYQMQLNEKCKFPTYYSREELERKLQNETENNICSDKLTAKEFAAEVGIIPIDEEDEDSDSTNSHRIYHTSGSTIFSGIQSTYNSIKSYGPRLDMSMFDPPNKISSEKHNESSKTIVPEFNKQSSSDTLNSNCGISLETIFNSKDNENETIEIVDVGSGPKENKTETIESVEKPGNSVVTPTRKVKTKKLSRFEIEVLSSYTPKSATFNPKRPSISTTGLSNEQNYPHSAKKTNSTGSTYYLNTTSSLPNLNELNKILNKNGNGCHTTPSSPARRDYGLTLKGERNDNVYFVCSNVQTRKPRRVSLSKHTSVNTLEDKRGIIKDDAKGKLQIIVDTHEENDRNGFPSSASTSSSSSPIHFEVKHPYSASSSKIDIYNLNNNDATGKTRNMTTTIITPDIVDTTNDSRYTSSPNTSSSTTPVNTPSAEELKNIWFDKTIGGNSNHVNKYHITNFQTEISKADNTIHTTTTSHIKDAMTNTDSVVFPIQIIKTPINGKCNSCLTDSKILQKVEDVRPNRLNVRRVKSTLSKSTTIDGESNDSEGKSEESSSRNQGKSEDGSNVVQVIQKGRFTVMKEHHDYKHAVPHHYKFVIIRNPSTNVLLPQTSTEGGVTLTSSSLSTPSYSYLDPTKNDLKHSHKETLSTIITPTSSSDLTTDQSSLVIPSLNVTSPPDSPCSSRSPTLSTISIPHQQLANIAAASLSSNLNMSEGIAYTTTIDSNCKSCCESSKNEEHVLIVPTNDEKQNNLTCIQSYTSTTTPLSSSLYISTITPVQHSLNKDFMPSVGPTTTPLNEDIPSTSTTPSTTPSITPSSTPSVTPSHTLSQELSSRSSPILFNQLSSTSTSPLLTATKALEETRSISSRNSQEFKLEPPQMQNSSREVVKPSSVNIAGSLQNVIPNSAISGSSSSSVLSETKPSVSPPIYPTLNSTVTLVNNNQNLNQNSILSEDLSIYTNYSDETYIHNDMENKLKHSEEISNIDSKPILHSETDIRRKKDNSSSNLRKVQSVIQCADQFKPYNYSYDSLDRVVSTGNVSEPLEMEEDEDNGDMMSQKPKYNPGSIEISNTKMDREVVTSPVFLKEIIGKKKYFPTHSYDQVLNPEVERKDSYYEYEQNDPGECNIERKYSNISLVSSLEPSMNSFNRCDFERTRAYSMSSVCPDIYSKYTMPPGSERESIKTTSTTATGELPTHPHHHHHFFIISNSEADMPTAAQLKYNNELLKDGNCSTRTVISSRQHRKFDITTSSISSKTPSVATSTKTNNSSSAPSLFKHKRSPSNSSNLSSHSRFTIIREASSKSVNNEKSPLSSNSSTIKKPTKEKKKYHTIPFNII
ncbi:hypothetical protein PIROE2DRAFT_64891 [Piromyces sp. E2]|nr:hypothetical protein PIROE2DRAFT_64891 [Piromyces sp. E2]|eukprot:OUM57642.1 hypothetical protein PIROE2DRAFT_64891 [Piromyces sp. E2]